ncbi:class I SAM-dependent methyltransferase [Actinophytocola sediminis]
MRQGSYDTIADWYEETIGPQYLADGLEIHRTLRELLGEGSGMCLEIGCGTGFNAEPVAGLGWTPVGVDLSAGMLGHGRHRLPVARADAQRLPVRDASVRAVVSVMAHTDMPAYPAVVRAVRRVLASGGVFVHVGVHPCFVGGFADHTDRAALVIRPGYRDSGWTRESWTDQGLRDKVGATHRPVPELLHAFLDAGLVLDRFAEGGSPTPTVLAIKAHRP